MDKKLNNLIKKNLEELKAIDTKILDLSQIDAFTDQLIITTGTSKPHITAISKKIKLRFMDTRVGVPKIGF